jgi:hypothetical protein
MATRTKKSVVKENPQPKTVAKVARAQFLTEEMVRR